MGARDTVMSETDIMITRVNASDYLRKEDEFGHPLITVEELAIATRQAEITFPAGQEEEAKAIVRCIKDAMRVHPDWVVDDIIRLLEFREETRQAMKRNRPR